MVLRVCSIVVEGSAETSWMAVVVKEVEVEVVEVVSGMGALAWLMLSSIEDSVESESAIFYLIESKILTTTLFYAHFYRMSDSYRIDFGSQPPSSRRCVDSTFYHL